MLVITPLKEDKQNLLDCTPKPKQDLEFKSKDTASAFDKSLQPSDNIMNFSPTAMISPHALITDTSLTATHAIQSQPFDLADSTRFEEVSASRRKMWPKRQPKKPSFLYNGDCDWFVMVMDGGD